MLALRNYRLDLLVTMGCLTLLAYLAYDAFEGARGYPFRDKLLAQHAKLTDDLANIASERKSIEIRVASLRPESVDPDLVDELARTQLSLSAPDELIVKWPRN